MPVVRRRRSHWVVELVIVVVVALVVAALVRAFVAQAFYIPSGSMEQTLEQDDWILVSKLSNYFGSIDHGEVVVFADPGGWLPAQLQSSNDFRKALEFIGVAPKSTEGDLVKRVIGVGGDHVTCCDSQGRVTVNGQSLDESYLYPGNAPSDAPAGCNGEFDVRVPVGYLWVMGDHREVSEDSRCQHGDARFVPEDNVRGRAVLVVWPVTHWSLLGIPGIFDAIN